MILTKSNVSQYKAWLDKVNSTGAAALIDKDADWTSFDVIAKLRPLIKIKKIGHAGTLDPLATGLLIVCFGKATKTISSYQDMRKSYSGVIKIGATTKTDDSAAVEENLKDYSNITQIEIRNTINNYIGEIWQKPPIFSAKKIKGQRLYQLARKNVSVEIEPVKVIIHKIDILNIQLPYISIDVECAKGTYIRALARDIGQDLGTGAYLSSLRRTAIGEYNVDDALRISDFVELAGQFPAPSYKK